MQEVTAATIRLPGSEDALSEILRQGAQQLLAKPIEAEAGRPAREVTSKLLPPYLRKTKSIEELIPHLYLKGISTGDFQEALSAILGPDCPGLSATTNTWLKSVARHLMFHS